ncbi:MAG: EAL domain-containing response regulator [Burkholderiaceae bacterium]
MTDAALRYLIVDDQAVLRRAMSHLLRRYGAVEIHEASDGRAALAIVQDPARSIDIVITDLNMPGMDGMEFMRHLGASRSDVSVVLCSSMDRNFIQSVEIMSQAYGVRFLGMVEKPFTAAKLVSLLARYQEGAFAARPVGANQVFSVDEILAGVADDEFLPFFQPKIAVATGEVVGAEALARWQHPVHGIVGPSVFIDVLEQAGMLDDLTFRIIRKSALACKDWLRAGHAGTVSVNLSPLSLNDVQAAENLVAVVTGTGLDAAQMIVEVTESTATTDVGPALENLTRLRMRGFGLSIDDYGTGYSSMQQLLRIPFTELKVDQSFVKGSASNETARAIVESSISIAKRLRLKTVAEGVESLEDLQVLGALGCDIAQGFLFAKPMPLHLYQSWLVDWSARTEPWTIRAA